MPRPQIQARVEPAREKEVEQFAEENDMSKAGAVRHLVERGLDYEHGRLAVEPEEEDAATEWMLRHAQLAIALSVLAAVGSAAAFLASTVLPPASAWATVGALFAVLALDAALVALGLSGAELIVQVRRHGAAADEAIAHTLRGLKPGGGG